jgi:hypothetical protein
VLARATLLIALAACSFPEKHSSGDSGAQGDGSAHGDGSGSGIAIGDLPAALENAICQFFVQCQIQPDLSTCLATNPSDTTLLRLEVAAVNAGKAHYDPVQAQVCLSSFSSATCAVTGLDVSSACGTVFTGTVADGGPCTSGVECKSQGCTYTMPGCDPATMCCQGTCATTPAPIGQACGSGPSTSCVNGAYCETIGATKRCTAKITTQGETCDAFDACAAPLVCGRDVNGQFTSCYTPAPRNAQCDPTQPQPCIDLRDYCNTATDACTQNNSAGQPCGDNLGERCVGYDFCNAGVCEAIPAPGQACPSNLCLGQLRCMGAGGNSSCTLPTPVTCSP